MSEFDLIARHFCRATPQTILGPGDDGALLRPAPGMELAVTSDMLVAGVHFLPDADPRDLGWKTLAVNLSDLAAMGANPRWALLALSLPTADENWLTRFAEGLFACARTFGVDLVGGDTTSGSLNLCVTALGEIPVGQALRRDGAQAGDDLWISGQPGLAALGLLHLQGKTELPEPWQTLCVKRLSAPQPRIKLGLALRPLAHAAIDISDGLLADLGHIARRSNLKAQVRLNCLPRLPEGVSRSLALEAILSGGDDYELGFAAPPAHRPTLARVATELNLPLWRIGSFEAVGAGETAGEVRLLDPDGQPVAWERRGYEHFVAA
ncbi:MAG: thiamine-phosphate kinase [Zoogloeaceae bacterium]|jgi:thiamine-monophosphate kinase|nr:thiamine-phosphate kinase [Zoogloeaceae bacterium]